MYRRIKIVADSNIPFLEGIFEPYADIAYIDGKDIRREDIINADALIIRTRTKCNEELLHGTRVSLIATATIGTDHIDMDYCRANGIRVYNAQGCNAGGVMAEREGPEEFVSMDYLVANSNIVTMHTPLDETTKGMADRHFFEMMRPGTFFINASRGEVVDEEALMEARVKLGPVIIDTWNNEPNINLKLLDMTDIATPHIAGYSFQGKQNGTASAVRAVARQFDINGLYHFYPACNLPEHQPKRLDLKGKTQGEITTIFQYNYPIFTDDFIFRMDPRNFERLRSEYQYRREIYVD